MPITPVNRVEIFNATANNPVVDVTAATSHTAGNLLVACLVTQGDGTPVITNTAADTWLPAGSVVTNNANRVWMFYVLATNGNANDITQFSIGNTGGGSYHAMSVRQFNTDNTWALDDNDGNTGFGTTASTPSLTLSGSEGVIVAIAENDGQNQIAGSGYTLTIFTDGLGGFSADEYKAVLASEAPSMTCGNDDWRMKAALFRDTGGGGGGTVVLMGQAVM